jgi:hypothetical protein
MAEKVVTPPKVYRVMIRVDVQQMSTEAATKLHSAIDDLVKDVPGSNVELSIVPTTPTR